MSDDINTENNFDTNNKTLLSTTVDRKEIGTDDSLGLSTLFTEPSRTVKMNLNDLSCSTVLKSYSDSVYV